jgi:hypothetical protein
VVIAGDHLLVVDGRSMGIARKEFPLTDELKTAARSDGGRHGVTIKIKGTDLEVVVRAGKPGAMREMTNSVPIDAAQYNRLVSRHMTAIGKDGYPRITPFIDDARRMPPDLTKPAAPNRWRFDGMDRLLTLYRACWRFKSNAPVSLVALKDEMLFAVDKDAETQKKAIEAYESGIAGIFRDVRDCGAYSPVRTSALEELMGIRFEFDWSQGTGAREVILAAKLRSLLDEPVRANIFFNAVPKTPGIRQKDTWPFTLGSTLRRQTITKTCEVTDPLRPTTFTATADMRWRGEELKLVLSRVAGPTCIPCWWVIGPFDNKGGGTVDSPQLIETETAVHLTNTYAGILGKPVSWRREDRLLASRLVDEFVLNLSSMYGSENASAYALVWVASENDTDATLAVGSDDGVVVWLNGERVHSNLTSRGYSSRQDRVPIHLKSGRNPLLVKVMQGGGGWAMGAHIFDKQGNPLPGVSYSLGDQ